MISLAVLANPGSFVFPQGFPNFGGFNFFGNQQPKPNPQSIDPSPTPQTQSLTLISTALGEIGNRLWILQMNKIRNGDSLWYENAYPE
jgi:hypothetical protein